MKRSIGIAQYRSECGLLAEHLVREQAVSDADVKAHTPGGANNPDKGADGWRSFDRWLQRQHAVMVHKQERQGGKFSDADDLALVDVLRGAPEDVTCVARVSDEDGAAPIRVRVYPKSFHALIEIAQIDRTVAWMAAHLERFKEAEGAMELDLVVRLMPEVLRLYKRLVWIVTHPGCGLPYAESEAAPTLPEWLDRLDVADCYRINKAHHAVNEMRLIHLRQLVTDKTGTPSTERPQWTVFFAAASESLKIRPESLMRDWSLAEALLMYRASNHVKEEAHDRAKAEANAGK